MNSPAVATDVKHSPASTHTPPLSMVISPLIFNSFATERIKRDQRKAELCDGQMPTREDLGEQTRIDERLQMSAAATLPIIRGE